MRTWQLMRQVLALPPKLIKLSLVRLLTRETKLLKNSQFINDRIKLGRRTMYTLFRAGMHGMNGINPASSYKLWQIHICSRMLHSLEALVTPKSQIDKLERYQRNMLKRIQHLPQSTSSSAIHLLLGAMPIQGTIDRDTLMFFGSILRHPDTTECQIIHRQLAIKTSKSSSWTIHVRGL